MTYTPNFQLHCFYGESENAIRIQIWCTLIDHLLMTVLQRKTMMKKSVINDRKYSKVALAKLFKSGRIVKKFNKVL